ncbi:MAG TPA: aspartyl protease family protein [Edaphobacter sp.]|nr:aspartyl protease family protein [Edaphobacter sp.]
MTRVQFGDRELNFILDTGDTAGSQLWDRFSVDFSAKVKQEGTKSTQQVNQVGGSNIRETTVLQEIKLKVGGLETSLRPATIFSQPVGDRTHHGLLGMDVLSQAREVQIDFRSMILQLLP